MAKGKKSTGKHYVSKGVVGTNRQISKETRRDYLKSVQRIENQMDAWRAGRNVVLVIANPDERNTRERFIRVDAKREWGDPRRKAA